jgi:ATP/maltotriose-dependent transcriptional regulator MalT
MSLPINDSIQQLIAQDVWAYLRAAVFQAQGEYDLAKQEHAQRYAAAAGREDHVVLAHTCMTMANLAFTQADYAHCAEMSRQALIIQQDIGDVKGVQFSLQSLARVASTEGKHARATRLFRSASALADIIGNVHGVEPWRSIDERMLQDAKAALGGMAFLRAWEAGGGMDAIRATAYALEDEPDETLTAAADATMVPDLAGPGSLIESAASTTTLPGVGPLTPREVQVANLIAQGFTNRQVAEALVISERTAETHARNIREKLGVRSRAQIATWIAERNAR